MMKVIINPDIKAAALVYQKLKENDYYCPCKLEKIPENKCMCEDFRNFIKEGKPGECHCGLYIYREEGESKIGR